MNNQYTNAVLGREEVYKQASVTLGPEPGRSVPALAHTIELLESSVSRVENGLALLSERCTPVRACSTAGQIAKEPSPNVIGNSPLTNALDTQINRLNRLSIQVQNLIAELEI